MSPVGRTFSCELIASFTGTLGFIGTVTDGVSELKVDVGPGYHVYYTICGDRLLLLGGNKSSQSKDIAKAIRLARDYEG